MELRESLGRVPSTVLNRGDLRLTRSTKYLLGAARSEQLGPTEGTEISLLNLNSLPQPLPPPEETPITPEQPLTSSAKSAPENTEFHVVMLKELQDDLTRSRLREAFWISVIVHIIAIISLATSPKWMPEPRKSLQMRSAEEMLRDRELTYLALPPDQQKPPAKVPDAKHLSDKNRIATSRNPQLDRKTLEDLRAGAPKPPGQPMLQGATQQQPGMRQQQQAAAQPSSMPTPPPNTNPNALQAPAQPQLRAANRNPFSQQPLTAGSAIAEATRGAARSGGGGMSGDYGSSPTGPRGQVRSNLDVLSDTQGVDFGPYLNRVVQNVRQNWYSLVPESAQAPLYKRGKVAIEFAILPDGKIAGMRLTGPSGDVALDRAAWGGISLSNPFPPLPSQFKGPYLALRFHFFYNPQTGEIQ